VEILSGIILFLMIDFIFEIGEKYEQNFYYKAGLVLSAVI
jgi:hypothetical protein